METEDFNQERAYAVNVAAHRHPTFAAYALERRLFFRFTPEEVARIRDTYEQWRAVVNHVEPTYA